MHWPTVGQILQPNFRTATLFSGQTTKSKPATGNLITQADHTYAVPSLNVLSHTLRVLSPGTLSKLSLPKN